MTTMAEFMRVDPVALPAQSAVATAYASTNLADAFAIRLPPGTTADPEALWRFVMSHQPAWIRWLTRLRDVIVACWGLKTARRLSTLSNEADAERIRRGGPSRLNTNRATISGTLPG